MTTHSNPASASGRRLYLHIGNHKTGTTSIQHYLAENSPALLERGFGVFLENVRGETTASGNASSWIAIPREDLINGKGGHVAGPEKLAARLHATNGDSVVVSAEDFAYLYSEAEIDALQRNLARYFDDIRVIGYLRRQDQQMLSFHQQGSKGKNFPSRILSGHALTALPEPAPHHRYYLDYHQRLSLWARAFGQDKLILRIFDPARLKNHDALADFLAILGLEPPGESQRYNESYGFERTKVGHLICETLPENDLSRALRAATDNRGKALPARATAQAFHAHYAESNRLLNQAFGLAPDDTVFSDDFGMYPEQPEDRWTEDTANQAMRHLLGRANDLYGQLSGLELRDAALALEQTSLTLSYKLMHAAYGLRPTDARIREKLDDYKRRLARPARYFGV